MFLELGKSVVRKIRAELSKQSRDGADDESSIKLDSTKGSCTESSSCC